MPGKEALSQRSERHGRPKAGRGAERAKRAERARSAFTVFRVKKKVPYMDQNEKKIFPFLNHTLTSSKRSTMKKKYAP